MTGKPKPPRPGTPPPPKPTPAGPRPSLADSLAEFGKNLLRRTPLGLLSNLPLAAGAAVGAGTIAAAYINKRPFDPGLLVPDKLIFPRDLANYSLSMSCEFKKYKRRAVSQQPYVKPDGMIRLPVPKGIQDKFDMTWTDKKQTPMVGAAVESILELTQGTPTTGAMENLGGVASGVLSTIQGFGITQANSALQKIPLPEGEKRELSDILQPLGLAVNPFLSVQFEQPTFKTHTFQWKFIPRDPDEAKIINKIIRLFKLSLLPDIAAKSGGTLLEYPNIVHVSFYGVDSYLYRFKPCAITSFTANYAPAATPSFFKGSQNVPTEIEINLGLKEIEFWTKQDFPKGYDPNTQESLIPSAVEKLAAAAIAAAIT